MENSVLTRYKAIRDKIHAHKEIADAADVDRLFAKTRIREIETLLVFLKKLYLTLWEMYFNGWKPVLRPLPYSASRMLKQHDAKIERRHVQQIIVDETVRALTNVQRGTLPRR